MKKILMTMKLTDPETGVSTVWHIKGYEHSDWEPVSIEKLITDAINGFEGLQAVEMEIP